MTDEKLLNEIGKLIDKAENYMVGSQMPSSPHLRIDMLVQGVVELRDQLRSLYEKCGGTCDKTWTLKSPYRE